MDDYVRESFVELMQRGIEVDVQPSNDVRILWLGQCRKSLFVAADKSSLATQQIHMDHIRVIRPNDGPGGLEEKLIEIVTDEISFMFNVDTRASRDILIRNLILIVDMHKLAKDSCPELDHTPTGKGEGIDLVPVLYYFGKGIASLAILLVGYLWYVGSLSATVAGIFVLLLGGPVLWVGGLHNMQSKPGHAYTQQELVTKTKVYPVFTKKHSWQTSTQPTATHNFAP